VADNLAISDVARVFGLRTSAIRYYEQIGILPPPVVQRAQESGFTLDEIRELFFGFRDATRPPKRWHELSERKIAELQLRMKRLKLMQTLLKQMQDCRCNALEDCGKKLLSKSSKERNHAHLR